MRFGCLQHLRVNKGFVFLPKAKPSARRRPCSTFWTPFHVPPSTVFRLQQQMWKLTGQTGENQQKNPASVRTSSGTTGLLWFQLLFLSLRQK